MKLMIVDDEPGIRDSLAEYFSLEGFDVITAANGLEALKKVEGSEELPDLILLDLRMPAMDGRELYSRMQHDVRTARIPVIVLTSDPGQAPSGVLIMRKPIGLPALMNAVRQGIQATAAPGGRLVRKAPGRARTARSR